VSVVGVKKEVHAITALVMKISVLKVIFGLLNTDMAASIASPDWRTSSK
jgi:hypothetical protein